MQADGYAVELHSYPLPIENTADEDLYIDTIYIPSNAEQKNLIVLTTGVHGIEGYIGSVMLDVFWNEICSLPVLNLEQLEIVF